MTATWALQVSPRAWQQRALQAWKVAGDRGVVAVVTGGGKTIFAYTCMLDLLERGRDYQTVIIVPTSALVDQWFVGLTEDLNVAADDIAIFGAGRRPGPKDVNLVVVNTARDVVPELAARRKTFLIVDECHRAASPENARALGGKHAHTLGLSATPERDFDSLFEDNVVPALGKVIYRYSYDEALSQGVVTPFSLTNVSVPLQSDEKTQYDKYTRQLFPLFKARARGEEVEDRLHRLLRERARVSTSAALRIPAAIRLAEEHRRERLLIFHEQIAAANQIVARLRDSKHRVAAYHSGLGPSLRQDNLRLFRRGEIDILVTCRALDEGINVPDASVAIIAASTASTRQRIQRLGRVLRPAKGKSTATVYTIYASEPEAQRLRQEASNIEGLDGVRWMSIQAR